MAYEKQTWRCGDTVTNIGLNHIEDGIEANDTAIANLQTQINNIDLGYSCTESRQTVFDGEYTTVKEEDSSCAIYENITPQTSDVPNILIVTFNGTEYSCPNHDNEFGAPYSSDGFDWSSYPFSIRFSSFSGKAFLCTENAGTYSVKAEVMAETAETSECFENAVKSVVVSSIAVVHITGNDNDGFESDLSCSEMQKVIDGGGYLVAEYNGNYYPLQTALDSSNKTTKGVRAVFVFSRTIVGTSSVTADEFRFMKNSCDIRHTTVVFNK